MSGAIPLFLLSVWVASPAWGGQAPAWPGLDTLNHPLPPAVDTDGADGAQDVKIPPLLRRPPSVSTGVPAGRNVDPEWFNSVAEKPLLGEAPTPDPISAFLHKNLNEETQRPINGLAFRSEAVSWRNPFNLPGRSAQPTVNQFDATAAAFGGHLDARLKGVPVTLSLGGRLGGAYLSSRTADKDLLAWDAEVITGIGVVLAPRWKFTGSAHGIFLLPGLGNDLTLGKGKSGLIDLGLQYDF